MPPRNHFQRHQQLRERRLKHQAKLAEDLRRAIASRRFSDIAVAVMAKELDEPAVGTKTIPIMPWTWGAKSVDCIGFVTEVMVQTFQHLNQESAARRARALRAKSGADLAKYLVTALGWDAIYWNPDVRNPADGDNEHPASYNIMACRGKHYYKVPIVGHLIDYNVQPPKPRDLAALQRLKQVKFAFGIARGAKHTFLVSHGNVYEAKWAAGAFTGDPYRIIPLEKYEWLSGALVMPKGDGRGFPMTCGR